MSIPFDYSEEVRGLTSGYSGYSQLGEKRRVEEASKELKETQQKVATQDVVIADLHSDLS